MLRHGESEANEAGLIVSEPAEGIKAFGLTRLGKQQVTISVHKAKVKGLLDTKVIIYSSDFKRAVETASIAKEILNCEKPHLTQALRERYFGDYDKKNYKNYAKVWARDLLRTTHNKHNVENLDNILDRATGFLIDLESKYNNETILLVGHADTLQVLQTAFDGVYPSLHRLKPLKIAEIRELERNKV